MVFFSFLLSLRTLDSIFNFLYYATLQFKWDSFLVSFGSDLLSSSPIQPRSTKFARYISLLMNF